MRKRTDRKDNLFIETRLGIVSRTGDWFHTTTEHIKKFVPGLLEKKPLSQIVEEAVAWVRSADSLSMTLLLVLLLFINPIFAAVVTLAFHFFWYRSKSAFVTIYLGKAFKLMNTDGYMLVTSLIILSYLGMSGQYLAVTIGLLFFLLLKPGLLKRLWDKIDTNSGKRLSLNDRVFKMILVKYGMHYNVEPAEVKQMEEMFKDLALSRKGNKSS